MPLGEAVPTLKGSEHLGWMLRGSTPRHRTVSVSVVMLTETTGTVATAGVTAGPASMYGNSSPLYDAATIVCLSTKQL